MLLLKIMREVILTHTIDEKIWFCCPVTILYKNDEFIIFRISIDTKTYRAVDQKGNVLRLGSSNWKLKESLWINKNLTYLVPFDDYIGYGALTNSQNQILEYYLNFQNKIRVLDNIIDTLDFELDFVIKDYQKGVYYWKDTKEYNALKSQGFFDKSITNKLILDEQVLLSLFEKYKVYLDEYSLKEVFAPAINLVVGEETFVSDINIKY